MKDEIISFKTAQLAKEKGFNVKNSFVYSERESYQYQSFDKSNEYLGRNIQSKYIPPRILKLSLVKSNSHEKIICEAPTQSLLQQWLRKMHNIYVIPIMDHSYSIARYTNESKNKVEMLDTVNVETNSYEEALEKGLYAALKLIKLH